MPPRDFILFEQESGQLARHHAPKLGEAHDEELSHLVAMLSAHGWMLVEGCYDEAGGLLPSLWICPILVLSASRYRLYPSVYTGKDVINA